MVASLLAQELEEEVKGVKASISDLVCAEELSTMAGKTWYIGPFTSN
jgi:hypothetical protein